MKQNLLVVSAVVFSACVPALAAEEYFVIRDSPTIQPGPQPGQTEIITDVSGEKAAWGSDALDGATISQMWATITRYDDTSRFSAGSGPAVAPYFNIWVTDGGGNFAVIANEPSNPAFQPLFEDNLDGSKTYDLDYTDVSSTVAKVYETPGWNTDSSWVHTYVGSGDPLTFADLKDLTILAPDASYINGGNSVGTGAPVARQADPNNDYAYGFNWVFGDTLSNYVSGDDGYIVGNEGASAVPTPAAFGAGLLGLASVLMRRR